MVEHACHTYATGEAKARRIISFKFEPAWAKKTKKILCLKKNKLRPVGEYYLKWSTETKKSQAL